LISKLKHTRLSTQQAQNYSKQKISLDWLVARDLQPAIAMKMHLLVLAASTTGLIKTANSHGKLSR
jgi:hypothetical protein